MKALISKHYVDSGMSPALNRDAKLLKERLSSIMTFTKKTKLATIITIILTLAIFFSSVLMGTTVIAASNKLLPTSAIDNHTEISGTTHPDNNQFASIDINKINDLKININAASVNLKTTNKDCFRLCYSGRADESYKASAVVGGLNKEIATISITGKPQRIISTMDITDIDKVTLEIPDKIFKSISITDKYGVLNLCEMNASITVSDIEGIINLDQSELKRGNYSLITNNGIIDVKVDSLLTKMRIDNTDGIVDIRFTKEPALDNFVLNIMGETKDFITLPNSWDKYIAKSTSVLKDCPSLFINNHSGFTDVFIGDKT